MFFIMVFPKSRASWRMSAFTFHKKHHRNFVQRMGEAPEASEASQASEARGPFSFCRSCRCPRGTGWNMLKLVQRWYIRERERVHTNEMISNSSIRYMTYEFILHVLSISKMQRSEAGKHRKQHMQKSWDARHRYRVKLWSVFCSSLFGGRILDHESWRMLQGLAHDWYCLMALVKVLGYIVDDGHVVGRNVKEAMNPRKLQSSEKHWKQRKKRIDCWSFARFVACGTVLSCFVNMFWAVSVDDFGMTRTAYMLYILL